MAGRTTSDTSRDGGIRASPAVESPRSDRGLLDEVESVARIGSYALDIPAGRWVSSKGLDAIFGIEARFERSVEGWVSLIHPLEREAMLAYLTDEVLGRGVSFDRQYRIVRADDGEERWVHGRGALEFGAAGQPLRMLGTIADVTEQRRAQDALIRSELRYAAIFEGTAEAILIAEVETHRFRWVNASACELLGHTRDELLELTVHDIHPPQDLPRILDQFRALKNGGITVARSVPVLRKDGTVLLADIKASSAVLDGVPHNIGFFTDVTDLRRLEAQGLKLAHAIEQTGEAILVTGPTGIIEYANPAFVALSGLLHEDLIGGDTSMLGSPHSEAVFGAMWGSLSAGAPWTGDLIHRRPDGTERVAQVSISPVRDGDATLTAYVAVERDVTEELALRAHRLRLVAAVEQASDSVIIADLAGTIEYVNPAFERTSGYGGDEAVGQNPRMLKSGVQSATFYRALWRRLTRGEAWTGTLINRRKDGALYEEEATISPIRGPDGAITGYLAVKRDVTALRAAESALAREFRERAEVAAALARLQPRGSAEETAVAICDELLGLHGIDVAGVIDFLDPQHAVPLAAVGPEGLPFAAGRPLPDARAAYLYARAAQGPWAEVMHPRHEDGPYGQAMAQAGLRALAYAPIRNGEGLLGLVAVGTRDEEYADRLVVHLPAVGEFAATAGAMLSPALERGHRDDLVRERIRRVLAERGFRPVFQPIIALASGEPVGYEALTRFAGRTPPDRMFAEAHSVGLGLDLEVACLAAALQAAEALPRDAWLSLNASPDLILHPSELPGLLADRSRPIVIEVTEHVGIGDYPALREAIDALGPAVHLAVDDAGAGFAGLRHIVELRPHFLKLDIGLVRHVDRDVARQAMVTGLRHYAARVGCEIIAEGIEEPADLEMLRGLGVPLGQGYLLGRPAPVRAIVGVGARPTKPRRRRAEGRSVGPSTATALVGARSLARTTGLGDGVGRSTAASAVPASLGPLLSVTVLPPKGTVPASAAAAVPGTRR